MTVCNGFCPLIVEAVNELVTMLDAVTESDTMLEAVNVLVTTDEAVNVLDSCIPPDVVMIGDPFEAIAKESPLDPHQIDSTSPAYPDIITLPMAKPKKICEGGAKGVVLKLRVPYGPVLVMLPPFVKTT